MPVSRPVAVEDGTTLDSVPSEVDIDPMVDKRLLSVPVMAEESSCVAGEVDKVEDVSLSTWLVDDSVGPPVVIPESELWPDTVALDAELAWVYVDTEDGNSIVSDWAELDWSITLLVMLSDPLVTPISLLLSVGWYVSEVLVPSPAVDSDVEESTVSDDIVGEVASVLLVSPSTEGASWFVEVRTDDTVLSKSDWETDDASVVTVPLWPVVVDSSPPVDEPEVSGNELDASLSEFAEVEELMAV
ncbi:hypothetical protein PG988_003917 [Apiospora saccharicola]